MRIEEMTEHLKLSKNGIIAVAAAEDVVVLQAVSQAKKRGFANAVLCGDRHAILDVAEQNCLDISMFEIVDTATKKDAARAAVSLVRQKKANMLMKGMIHTADLLRAVLDKENGLREREVLSHVSVVSSPVLERTLLLTDAAMVPYPDLPTKVKLIENAVIVAHGLGIAYPRVAPLAAVEIINPNMPATMDAAILSVMNRRNQITGCMVDGPLAMDAALSETAASHKGIDSSVAGKADILLFHNIEAANSVLKTFTNAGNCLFGGIVMGASAPIILASRSDSEYSKLYSIICASAISAFMEQPFCESCG
ncbi:MAG: bifunctional enoyl-CoA hydratase/phosphate acetyltransferase [Christensenella sp.]|nr:bifunctional enoyl-CoA hydratase/phosphate acetyltransferase [Christensenella sp.]